MDDFIAVRSRHEVRAIERRYDLSIHSLDDLDKAVGVAIAQAKVEGEGAYAHARLAREVVATVLAEKVDEGYLGEDEALSVGRKMLHDNGFRLFGLEHRAVARA